MKILKYLFGLIATIGGILSVLSASNRNKKVKELKTKVNQSKKVVDNKKKQEKKLKRN